MKTIFIAVNAIIAMTFLGCATEPAKSEIKASQVGLVVSFVSDVKDEFSVEIFETGRYRITIFGNGDQANTWLEDYIDNNDNRVYNVTGNMAFNDNNIAVVEGSPFQAGTHKMRIHANEETKIDSIKWELMIPFEETLETKTQNMEGDSWELVWSDEFELDGLPDNSKWLYNVGNWGWGNNELQYYTQANSENARVENGSLIIEAHKNVENGDWSSARLTTQGKVAFKYGKIEFRAKVPSGRGTWAAGWMLGDKYRDEISWPYCGEIDILECVGYEIDDSTGAGQNHGTCHTPAYYFKKNNQVSRVIDMDSMNTKFHTFSVEWYPNVIHGFVDGNHYYTYDKVADSLEWPFHQAQNIILNLAIGGGWGGLKGVDESLVKQRFEVDYVRVYQKK